MADPDRIRAMVEEREAATEDELRRRFVPEDELSSGSALRDFGRDAGRNLLDLHPAGNLVKAATGQEASGVPGAVQDVVEVVKPAVSDTVSGLTEGVTDNVQQPEPMAETVPQSKWATLTPEEQAVGARIAQEQGLDINKPGIAEMVTKILFPPGGGSGGGGGGPRKVTDKTSQREIQNMTPELMSSIEAVRAARAAREDAMRHQQEVIRSARTALEIENSDAALKLQANMDQKAQLMADFQKEQDQFKKDVAEARANSKLAEASFDPERFLGGNGSARRWGFAVLAALGTLGAGLRQMGGAGNGRSAAMSFINQAIERDIMQQQQAIKSARGQVTALGENLEQMEQIYGSRVAAAESARLDILGKLAIDLEARKASATSDLEAARIDELIAAMKEEEATAQKNLDALAAGKTVINTRMRTATGGGGMGLAQKLKIQAQALENEKAARELDAMKQGASADDAKLDVTGEAVRKAVVRAQTSLQQSGDILAKLDQLGDVGPLTRMTQSLAEKLGFGDVTEAQRAINNINAQLKGAAMALNKELAGGNASDKDLAAAMDQIGAGNYTSFAEARQRIQEARRAVRAKMQRELDSAGAQGEVLRKRLSISRPDPQEKTRAELEKRLGG